MRADPDVADRAETHADGEVDGDRASGQRGLGEPGDRRVPRTGPQGEPVLARLEEHQVVDAGPGLAVDGEPDLDLAGLAAGVARERPPRGVDADPVDGHGDLAQSGAVDDDRQLLAPRREQVLLLQHGDGVLGVAGGDGVSGMPWWAGTTLPSTLHVARS